MSRIPVRKKETSRLEDCLSKARCNRVKIDIKQTQKWNFASVYFFNVPIVRFPSLLKCNDCAVMSNGNAKVYLVRIRAHDHLGCSEKTPTASSIIFFDELTRLFGKFRIFYIFIFVKMGGHSAEVEFALTTQPSWAQIWLLVNRRPKSLFSFLECPLNSPLTGVQLNEMMWKMIILHFQKN